jgi:EAL domain-containing protein (putative c-di-GMP-specific phosphodiesterase class I)
MVFEITERDTVKNLNLIEKNVRNLKQEGFQFAIDDFGSGYSSFLYIKMFQVDYLKIDGEFIRNMTGSGTEDAIVSNITALAGRLGIKTIAEHVESEAIFGNVRSVGIDCAQGYFIQRPAPDLTPGVFTKM